MKWFSGGPASDLIENKLGVNFDEGGNRSTRRKPSKSGWDRLKLNPHTYSICSRGGRCEEVNYASLTSQVVQKTAFYLDGHPSRYQPCPKGLTLVNRREPVFCLWLEPYPFSFPKQFTHTYWLISWYSNLQVIMQSREQKLFNLTKKKVKYQWHWDKRYTGSITIQDLYSLVVCPPYYQIGSCYAHCIDTVLEKKYAQDIIMSF